MDRIKRAGAFFSIIVMCILFCGCDMQEVQGTLSEITDKGETVNYVYPG